MGDTVCNLPYGTNKIIHTLEKQTKQCDELILCLNSDIEGGNIVSEVVNVYSIALMNLNVKRARFSAVNLRLGIDS
jgi:DNA topoisomerase IA